MDHYTAKSRNTWGRDEQKSPEELNRLCNAFFEKLVVPKGWKDIGWVNVEGDSVLLSVGKLFRDMRTSGIDLMHYRVFFNSLSTKGGICAKTIVDFGKFAYKAEIYNKTVDQLNQFIHERYNEITSHELMEEDITKDDGLQHFRDRFGTGVAAD